MEYTYRGKKLEELMEMDIDEFAKLVKSRARKRLLNLTEQDKKFLEKVEKKGTARTHIRDMVVVPKMIGKKIGIHNGKEFVIVEIKPEHLGLRLGELAPSRKRVKHSSPGIGATKSKKAPRK